ncbi:hypothetical protein BC941DRAFT_224563 [Chlamydoabsidia padenii]|nr:hypothetical protein BC941DRAFT_224563 [Chlamydoabsidia padenii]
MRRTPGECLRQHCSINEVIEHVHLKLITTGTILTVPTFSLLKYQFAWTRNEDIKLISRLEAGWTDVSHIALYIYPKKQNMEARVENRMKLLERNNLNTMALYEKEAMENGVSCGDASEKLITDTGALTIDRSKIDDEIKKFFKEAQVDMMVKLDQKKKQINDVKTTRTRDPLRLSDSNNDLIEKALQTAVGEIDRQKKRIRTINQEWVIQCTRDMVARDYQLYVSYNINSKYSIHYQKPLTSKTGPTYEAILPMVMNGYARSADKCNYCGRLILFLIKDSDEAKEKGGDSLLYASPDHFDRWRMAYTSETYFQFTCWPCNRVKSTYTHKDFKSYIDGIKTFHQKKMDSRYVDETNKDQAVLMWMAWKTDKKMGLRDPFTGVSGYYSSTKDKYIFNKFMLCSPRKDTEVITGCDLDRFKSLNVEIMLTFTDHAIRKLGGVSEFNSWLKVIQDM